MSYEPNILRPELELDKELSDEWVIRTTFVFGQLSGNGFEQLASICRADRQSCSDEGMFLMEHATTTGHLELITSGPIVGTQAEALTRASQRYRKTLGSIATSRRVIIAHMNSASITDAFMEPFSDQAIETLEEPELTQETWDYMKRQSAPRGLDVTKHLKNLLA